MVHNNAKLINLVETVVSLYYFIALPVTLQFIDILLLFLLRSKSNKTKDVSLLPSIKLHFYLESSEMKKGRKKFEIHRNKFKKVADVF